jgi:hypothetical protein
VNHAEVALPDERDAREDGDEEHALGENAWSHEVEIRNASGRNRSYSREYFTED